MKIDDSRKKQLIILCCLVAVLVSVGAYRVIGLSGGVAMQGHQPPQAIEESNQAAAGQADGSQDQVAPGPAATKVSTSRQVSRDPFEPQIVPEAARSRTAVSTARQQPPLIAQGTPLPLVGPFPPESIGFKPIPEAEEDPARALRLTGVIEGDTNVAIIRGAGGERYIVREGQKIDGRYVVRSISRAGVRLGFKNKSFVLGLGDNQAS